MFAAKTDIPCVLTDIPYILASAGGRPLGRRTKKFFDNIT